MQNSNYEVSILIPTYNRSNLIRNAIESSLMQTQKCEIIVCDHGSNDETKEICESYGNDIKYIRREEDYGIHFCELESILASKSKYIHFCFDDDWMHPEFIARSLSLMNNSIGVVFSGYKTVKLDASNGEYLKWEKIKKYKCETLPWWRFISTVMSRVISPSRALVRREDALKSMYMTTNLMSDSYYNGVGPDWLMTAYPIFNYPKSAYIENKLVSFGVHEKSITCDVINKKDIESLKAFRAAYRGARLYLLVSFLIKKIKLEKIAALIESFLRFTKKLLLKSNFKFL